MGRSGGVWRAVGWGVVAALLLAAAGVVAVRVLDLPIGGRDELPERVVLAVACPGEDGAVATPVIALVDTALGTTTALDPLAEVVIPGTSYDRLRDAYAFGGGAAVAAAVARLDGGAVPGYVVLDAEAWVAAVDEAGGVALDSPTPVDVFTGERLFSFPAGAQLLSGAATCEYLKGLAYLTDTEREGIAQQFADALTAAVVAADPDSPGVATDLSGTALAELRRSF